MIIPIRQEDTFPSSITGFLLEPGCGLAELHSKLVATLLVRFLLDDVLGAMRLKEFTTCFVVIECELIGQESKGDFYVASTCQRGRSMLTELRTL